MKAALKPLKIKRALLSVSDKSGLEDLGRAMADAGVELIATGNTKTKLEAAGLKVTPIESVSGSPEAFQGRMKTISFPVFSGILFKREDSQDEADAKKLGVQPIDAVVVNFYPFEKAPGVENIDIGGPSLVRAAAKNSPDVLVLTDSLQYPEVIRQLKEKGEVEASFVSSCAKAAWKKVSDYDSAISKGMGAENTLQLRYGENPHQGAELIFSSDSPVDWNGLTTEKLSFNNILDITAAYGLASDLSSGFPDKTGVIIVKHNNPCGVALVSRDQESAQKVALQRAWEGDPVSAFGGVLVFTHPLEDATLEWLSEKFIEVIAAPNLGDHTEGFKNFRTKKKKLKAASIRHFNWSPARLTTTVPGGVLLQEPDNDREESFQSVTAEAWNVDKNELSLFGILICRALKSNAIAIVREIPELPGAYQLVGAGQGQPNRVDAIQVLAVPRAQGVLRNSGGRMEDCILISDAFFPFRDAIEVSHTAGIKTIVQPGGSKRDPEVIEACNEFKISMAFTGKRHFRH